MAGKNGLEFDLFAVHLKLRCHTHFSICTCTLVQSKCVFCIPEKLSVLLDASVSCLTAMMLNPSRNSNRNKTSTHYYIVSNNPVLEVFYIQSTWHKRPIIGIYLVTIL